MAWVAEWYTRESQKLVVVMTLRVRVSPQALWLKVKLNQDNMNLK